MRRDVLVRVGLVWIEVGWCSDGDGFYVNRRGAWKSFGVFVELI